MSERAGSRPPERQQDHRPARQRHRAPQRASTPLTQITGAVTDQLGDARRTGAIAVISTGLVAGVALPAQGAVSHHPSTSPLTTAAGPATAAAPAYSSLGARALTAGAALGTGASTTAPRAAVVSFETGRFTALPKPPPPKPVPAPSARPIVRKAATAKPAAAEPTTRREAREAAKAAAARAAQVRQRAAAEKAAAQKAATEKAAAQKAAAQKAAVHKTAAHKAAVKKGAEAAKRAAEARRKAAEAKKKAAAHKHTGSAVKGASVISIAARYVGTPYRYGGTTPRGFDCSGFTKYVYSKVGIALPRTANQQMHATRRIKRSAARPGDLVFFVSAGRAYHVAIYAGGGMMYDSPRTGKTVSKRKIWTSAVVFGRVKG